MDEGEASTSNSIPRRKGCGRRKIEIKKIDNQRKRWVAFSKRKKGIFKKAAQLSMLTGETIGVVIISEQGRVYTSDNIDSVIEQYLSIKEYQAADDIEDSSFKTKEAGEVLQKNSAAATLTKMKRDKCLALFDLNKTPDEQFS
ncbi:Transcription factor, MADS-box [Corchorus olitorius]|uniref:Transcription factor, MADS-box n=1 Tax=Corchorus olitorius TaxID=93759 RepID=A0A1R3KJX9_9ROSI|nr:Transcription factor, MADS-box [Corchorus olitorius]